ncbi:hypothetical protein ACFL5V_11960 [Fibrobacterota bacterium]
MRDIRIIIPLVFASVFFGISTCSLNLKDPAREIQEEIDKPYPLTFEAVVGCWTVGSVLSAEGAEITDVNTTITLEVLRDSTYVVTDETNRVFDNLSMGRIEVSQDQLLFFDDNHEENVPTQSFSVGLTFLGNYMKLTNPSDNQESSWDKMVKPDFEDWHSLLLPSEENNDSLLEFKGWRGRDNKFNTQEFESTFSYLMFLEDTTLKIEANEKGLVNYRILNWELSRDTIKIKPEAGDEASYLVDMFNDDTELDSLRLWPVATVELEGFPETGTGNLDFLVFVPVNRRHEHFLDIGYLPGYWRSDTLTLTRSNPSSYGNYYDLNFESDGSVEIISNIDNAPVFSVWDIYNGGFRMQYEGPSSQQGYFIYEVQRLDSMRVLLNNLSGPAFKGVFTKMETPELFFEDPLKRFDDRSYASLFLDDSDVPLLFFFSQKYRQETDGRENVEMTGYYNSDSIQLGMSVKPGESLNTTTWFLSGQPGFTFAFTFRDSSGEAALLFSDTAESSQRILQTRSYQSSVSSMVVDGDIANGIVIDSSENEYSVSGRFRYRRDADTNLNAEFWSQLPVKQ